MSGARACRSCRHAREASAAVNGGAKAPLFICRRFPPQPSAVVLPVQTLQGQGLGVQVVTGWPQVAGDDVCGEFDEANKLIQ